MTTNIINKLLSLIVILFISIGSLAQNPPIDGRKKEIDSLRNILVTAKDTARINALINLSNRMKYVNSDSAIIYALQAYREAVGINYYLGAANALRRILSVYRFIGNIMEQEDYFDRITSYYGKAKEKTIIRYVHSWRGETLFAQCRFQEALKEHQRYLAEVEREAKDDKYARAWANNNIGIAFYGLGEYEKAYEHLLKSLELSLDLTDTASQITIQAYAYEAMGNLYLNFDDIETAKYYYEKSPIPIWDDQWRKIDFEAGIFLKNKNFDSALIYREKHSQYNFKTLIKEIS